MEHNWSLRADMLSVTVGINTRIALLRSQRRKPVIIRLGGWATRQYLSEYGLRRVPEDYYHAGIPVRFRDPIVIGIAIEGEDQLPKLKHPE